MAKLEVKERQVLRQVAARNKREAGPAAPFVHDNDEKAQLSRAHGLRPEQKIWLSTCLMNVSMLESNLSKYANVMLNLINSASSSLVFGPNSSDEDFREFFRIYDVAEDYTPQMAAKLQQLFQSCRYEDHAITA